MYLRLRPLRACLICCLLSCVVLLCNASSFDNGTSFILINDTGTVIILDPTTGDEVDQTSASDGAGDGMNLPAVLWLIFSFLLGVPLSTMGVRLGRFTSGAGLGIGLAVSFWASFINSIGDSNVSDLIILAITVVLFAVGFVVGFITIEYRVGAAVLGVAGGISIMMRLILMKENLLVPIYIIDWLLCGLCGLIGLILVAWNERRGVIIGSSAAGSFMICLGIDLLINKQSGMSWGLRFLFDRNENHLADIFGTGYTPLLSTQILMAVTIVSTAIFAFAQHKLFPQPFRKSRHRASSLIGDDASVRSRTWIGRFRGRTYPPPLSAKEPDEAASTQRLVASSEEGTTLNSHRGQLNDKTLAAAGVPILK